MEGSLKSQRCLCLTIRQNLQIKGIFISKYCVADLQVNMKLCTSFGHSFFVTIYQYVFAPKFKNQYLILNCHCPFKNAN